MDHKYITCTGFGGTGSSVISDLMQEYQNVKSCGANFEMTLAFDFGGLSDLQHYVVDDFERNKTAEGINMFINYTRNIEKVYSKKLGINFNQVINDYLTKLIQVNFNGYYRQHVFRYNKIERQLFYYIPFLVQRYIKRFFPAKDSYERYPQCIHKLPINISADKDVFFEATKNLMQFLLDSMDPEGDTEMLCFDQLVPAYNFNRYSKYFPNLRIIVVDRDPRDLYILNKLFWGEGWIPSDDIDIFISWYKLLRNQIKKDIAESDDVLYVNFEDTIYHYDAMVNRIEQFIGLESNDHIKPKSFFNPEISIKNTRLWDRFNEYNQDVEQIENKLLPYCYKY